MPAPCLQTSNLVVSHGAWHTSPLTLTLQPGQRIGLAGESGSGKTTLLKALMGLHTGPTTGQLTITPSLGYVPQDILPSLSPYRTALRQLADLTPAAPALLQQVGLTGPRRPLAYPHQLSGGERQRLLIAQALARNPQLLLADEPTANLDQTTEDEILHLLHHYLTRTNAAILIASHRHRVFERLGCTILAITPQTEAALPSPPPTHRPEPLVHVRNLTRIYTRRDALLRRHPSHTALNGITFQIDKGEMLAVVGRSGAGKSTLARCLAHRDSWQRGTIDWCAPRAVQLVQQEPSESLNPRFTIAQTFHEAGASHGEELLERMRLHAIPLTRKVRHLSEGQRARVAIARSIAALNGGLLILDESLSGLDHETRSAIVQFIHAEQLRTGMSTLLITHDEALAASVAHRTLRIREGELAQ